MKRINNSNWILELIFYLPTKSINISSVVLVVVSVKLIFIANGRFWTMKCTDEVAIFCTFRKKMKMQQQHNQMRIYVLAKLWLQKSVNNFTAIIFRYTKRMNKMLKCCQPHDLISAQHGMVDFRLKWWRATLNRIHSNNTQLQKYVNVRALNVFRNGPIWMWIIIKAIY